MISGDMLQLIHFILYLFYLILPYFISCLNLIEFISIYKLQDCMRHCFTEIGLHNADPCVVHPQRIFSMSHISYFEIKLAEVLLGLLGHDARENYLKALFVRVGCGESCHGFVTSHIS